MMKWRIGARAMARCVMVLLALAALQACSQTEPSPAQTTSGSAEHRVPQPTPTVSPAPIAKPVAADQTASDIRPAPTAPPAPTAQPASTPEDEPPAVAPQRIRFAAGESSAVIKRAVIRGEQDTFLLWAKKGQRMILRISALEKNAAFDLVAPGGSTIASEATSWNDALPANGNYRIVVGPTRGNATYELRVEIQ